MRSIYSRGPNLIPFAFCLVAALTLIAGCQTSQVPPEGGIQAQAAPTPGKFTEADIAKLKWIEGTGCGTGEKQPAFYERYRFEGTTMIVDALTDETLKTVSESSRFELKDGQFGHTEGNSRSAASTLTEPRFSSYL